MEWCRFGELKIIKMLFPFSDKIPGWRMNLPYEKMKCLGFQQHVHLCNNNGTKQEKDEVWEFLSFLILSPKIGTPDSGPSLEKVLLSNQKTNFTLLGK